MRYSMHFRSVSLGWLSRLRVVLLVEDVLACPVLQPFNPGALFSIEAAAIGAAARFVTVDLHLIMFKARGFACGQAAIADPFGDPLLLMVLALIDTRFGRDGSGKRGEPANGGDDQLFTHYVSPSGRGRPFKPNA